MKNTEQKQHNNRARSISPLRKKPLFIQTLKEKDKDFWDEILYKKDMLEYYFEQIKEEKDENIYRSKLYKYKQLNDNEIKNIINLTKDYAYKYKNEYINMIEDRYRNQLLEIIIESLTKFLSVFQTQLSMIIVYFDKLEIEFLLQYFKKLTE